MTISADPWDDYVLLRTVPIADAITRDEVKWANRFDDVARYDDRPDPREYMEDDER